MATIADLKRMCKSFENCENCSLRYGCGTPASISDAADEVVGKWSKEHPKKTFRDDFLEKFPDAPVDSSGFPNVCLMDIYKGADYKCKDEDYDCNECWNQEYKKC